MKRVALCASSQLEVFREVAAAARCLASDRGSPWRFYDGYEEAWYAPEGSLLRLREMTPLGRAGVSVHGDHESEVTAIFTALREAIPLRDWTEIQRGWDEAVTPQDALQAVLDCTAWASLHKEPVDDPDLCTVWQDALDHPHPVVRLAAVRGLWIFPVSLRVELLDGREDADNPGMARWREHFESEAQR